MMQGVFYDTAGRYFVPPEGVTLATLGAPPYSPPGEDWDGEVPGVEVSGPTGLSSFGAMPWAAVETAAPGAAISFADMVRTISPVAEPDVWREDNRAPFWIPDDARAGPSFDDLAGTIDPRAVALGVVRIPGLPEDATEWGWHDRSPGRGGEAERLASMWNRIFGLELATEYTPHEGGGPRGLTITGGGVGGGRRGGGSSGSGRAAGASGSSDKYIPGADAAGEGPNGVILNGIVYRGGGPNPGNWKAKPGQDHSTRDTVSNPWPMPSTGPVFRVRKPITEVDAAKLPPGSVVRDNDPPGHVNIDGSLLWDLIQKAIKRRP